jgi:hypothetical protein
MRVAGVLLLLVVFFSLTSLIIYGDRVEEGYPQLPENIIVNPVCSVYAYNESILIICPESVLISGLEITLNTTAFNILHIYIANVTPREIVILFYYEPLEDEFQFRRVVDLDLPYPDTYAGVTVYGWNFTAGIYHPWENKTYYFTRVFIAKPNTWSRGCALRIHAESRVFYFRLSPVLERAEEMPSLEEDWSPPEWWDILGWIRYLLRMLGIFARGLGIGIYTIALMISRLLSLTPYLAFIIPLHIISAFVYSPVEGIKAVKFYLELGRKLFDLFIKVVKALAEFVQAVIPI